MGLKAVFGLLASHILCFGGRGEAARPGFYAIARGAAERSAARP